MLIITIYEFNKEMRVIDEKIVLRNVQDETAKDIVNKINYEENAKKAETKELYCNSRIGFSEEEHWLFNKYSKREVKSNVVLEEVNDEIYLDNKNTYK